MLDKEGANLNFIGSKGVSPLNLAVKANQVDSAKYLIARKV